MEYTFVGCMLLLLSISLHMVKHTASKHSTQSRKYNPKDTVYTFAFSNDGFPKNFVDNHGNLVGQSVDLVHKVCSFGNRRCETALVAREDCWECVKHPFPGYSPALNGRWFDACANLPPTKERKLGYAFPTENYFRTKMPSIIVHKHSYITLQDLISCNNFTLVYPGNTGLLPYCMHTSGYHIGPAVSLTPLGDLTDVTKAQVEMVSNKTVDLALVITAFLNSPRICLENIKILSCVNCGHELTLGLNVMMRKDDKEFLRWWNNSLHRFMCSGQKYENFCKYLSSKYGVDPMCRYPGTHVDCSQYGGPALYNNQKCQHTKLQGFS